MASLGSRHDRIAISVFRVGSLLQVRLPELEGTRDARGRFTAAQGRMRDRNKAFAQSLQRNVVELVEQRITRPSASTRRLVTVTGAPENAQYDTWSAGVGVVSFLDHSQAKYWRTFEEGSAAVWSHPFTGTQLLPKGTGIPFPVAHGRTPGIRTTTAQLPWMDGRRWVVGHEIAPRHAYLDAVHAAGAAGYARASAQQFIRDVLGQGG